MPLVSIKTGSRGKDGRDEILLEFLCDWPGCGKVAEHVLDAVRELASVSVACDEHAPKAGNPAANPEKAD
jgi:hypothetical protein